MGNQHSRYGDYRPGFPPKQAYYSERSTRRKHRQPYDHNDGDYEDEEYAAYSYPQYPTFTRTRHLILCTTRYRTIINALGTS